MYGELSSGAWAPNFFRSSSTVGMFTHPLSRIDLVVTKE